MNKLQKVLNDLKGYIFNNVGMKDGDKLLGYIDGYYLSRVRQNNTSGTPMPPFKKPKEDESWKKNLRIIEIEDAYSCPLYVYEKFTKIRGWYKKSYYFESLELAIKSVDKYKPKPAQRNEHNQKIVHEFE